MSFVKNIFTTALLMAAATAVAMVNPPYDLYPYLADSTDNPPLNYTKVCEPGRSGEANASYVALGIWFPRAYPALANTATICRCGRTTWRARTPRT